MGLCWAKYARRIFAIVSTTSIPYLAPVSPTEATVDPPSRDSRLDANHPQNGGLIPRRLTVFRSIPCPTRIPGIVLESVVPQGAPLEFGSRSASAVAPSECWQQTESQKCGCQERANKSGVCAAFCGM